MVPINPFLGVEVGLIPFPRVFVPKWTKKRDWSSNSLTTISQSSMLATRPLRSDLSNIFLYFRLSCCSVCWTLNTLTVSPLQSGKTPRKTEIVLGRTLNNIWCWGSSSEALGRVVHFFIVIKNGILLDCHSKRASFVLP